MNVPKKKYKFRDAVVFLILLNIFAIPLYVALFTNFSFAPLQELNAKMLYWTLKVFGFKATIDGYDVELFGGMNAQMIEISWDSTAWKSMYALAALVIATPILQLSHRIKVALLGVGIIFVLNYIRVSTTILASVFFGFNTFDLIHGLLWREGMILAVLAIWMLWMRREKYNIAKIK